MNGEKRSLVTEKDIDGKFGLFVGEERADAIPTAEEELLEVYPYDRVLGEEEDRVREAEARVDRTPVDPAAPEEEFHGTDLINGVGSHPEQEDE